MQTYVALFRGINVGGSHLLPMKQLTLMLEQNGCSAVQTYIQSGNAVFRSATNDCADLAKRVTAAVSKHHGFEPHVLVLTRRELERAVAQNPFTRPGQDPRTVHFFFLIARPKNPDLKALEALKTKTEQFVLRENVFYLYTPDGLGRSKLAARVERLLGVAATARNARTVAKLAEMTAAGESET